MRNLGITRDGTQLDFLKLKAEEKDIQIVPLPVTEISYIITDKNQLPDFSHIDWIFFTSANGVRAFFATCKQDTIPQSIKFASVGKNTTEAIKSFGKEISFIPSEAYGKNLFQEFIQKYNKSNLHILYVRAEKVVLDPKNFFEETQITFSDLIVYKSQEKSLQKSDVDIFSSDDFILFTAPSTVVSYNNQFGKPKAKLIAIGNTTKEAIEKNNWTTHIVLDKPEIEKVLEYM